MAHSSRNLLPELDEIVSAALTKTLSDPSAARFVVAYSGGLDSRVLLQVFIDLGLTVRAIHINHQLQSDSDHWQQHCVDTCASLGVALDCIPVDAVAAPRESPEAAAREARYPALLNALHDDEILLLAQHCDDQAETVLIQLMRGAGAAGLSAMPVITQRVNSAGVSITMLRPLLDATREQLAAFASQYQLQWVEDPSNTDTAFRRNAVRHRLMPVLDEITPQPSRALARVASQQQANAALLDDLARIDLAQCVGRSAATLQLSKLKPLSEQRQFNVLRYWLHAEGTRPNRAAIRQIQSDVLHASANADPCVRWGRYEVKRADGLIHVLEQQRLTPASI